MLFPFHRFSYPSLIACVLVGLMFSTCRHQSLPDKLIVGKGGNIHTIVLPAEADEVMHFAASELQRYVQRITGDRLNITEATSHDHDEKLIRFQLISDSSFRWDGYRLRTTENGLECSARESRGLLYAVYDLLQQWDCAFVYPGQAEEIVPVKEHVLISPMDTVITPLLEHRGLAPYGLDAAGLSTGREFIDWMAKNRMNYILVSEDRPSDSDGPAHGSVWKEVQQTLLPELQKRGFVIEMSEHCTPVFFPRSLFNKHPEWFALNNGVRKLGPPPYSGQICYSNKDAIAYYANALAKYAAAHPEFHTIGTWPLDGGEYCECDNCKDPQTVFNAVLHIADKIKKVRPDILVEHLAYKEQTWQPPANDRIPGNISVLWCRDAGQSEALAREWIKKTNPHAGVYQFEYYLGDNYRSRANVWLRPHYAAGIVKHARETGYRGVISLTLPIQNWWRSSFNNWFFARSCWQELNVDREITKYCKMYYGDFATPSENIFRMITTKFQKEPYMPLPDSIAASAGRIHDEGSRIIQLIEETMIQCKDSIIDERFARIKTYVEFMMLHARAYATRNKKDLDTLMRYSSSKSNHALVLMYPGYIYWRCEEDL